jgi:5-deoxy-D-glucuronate isomerase
MAWISGAQKLSDLELDWWEYAVYQNFTLEETENLWLETTQWEHILTILDVQDMLNCYHKSVKTGHGKRKVQFDHKKGS